MRKLYPFVCQKLYLFVCVKVCVKKCSVWEGEKACAISTKSGGGGCRESVFGFAAVYIVWYAKAIPFCMSKVIIISCRKLYLFVCRFLVCVFMLSLRQTYKHIFLSLVSCQQKKDPIPPPLAIRSTSMQTNISIMAQGSSSCTFWRCRS